MQNPELDESWAKIKIARRNINNLRYAADTTLMTESRGTKQPLDDGETGEWKSWLKTQHSKTDIKNRVLNSVGEDEGGMIWEGSV